MPECDGGFDDEWDCRDGRPLEDDAGQADPRLPPGARPGDHGTASTDRSWSGKGMQRGTVSTT
jgi:hypothetical protein